MKLPLYKVDAFTTAPFKGNPAAVCIAESPLEEDIMKAIAREMNLSETAFVVHLADNNYSLRWFTPKVEVPLCGHATLATAKVLFDEIGVVNGADIRTDVGANVGAGTGVQELRFQTKSGLLKAVKTADGITLDFPLDDPVNVPAPAGIIKALGNPKVLGCQYGKATKKLLVHLEDEEAVIKLTPDFPALKSAKSDPEVQGLIVTAEAAQRNTVSQGNSVAQGKPYDFISRYFAVWVGIDEDPATGSAHTVLAPYWGKLLGKNRMRAYQASSRGGEMEVRLPGSGRVDLIGQAVVVEKGHLYF